MVNDFDSNFDFELLILWWKPLSEVQQQSAQTVLNAIAAMRGKKRVTASFKVDPQLVGGLRFFLDDKEFFDFSVSQEIDAFEERLASKVGSLP